MTKLNLFLFWSPRETTDHNSWKPTWGIKAGLWRPNTNLIFSVPSLAPHASWDQILSTAQEQKGSSQQGHQQAAVPTSTPSRGVTLNSPFLGQKDFFQACLATACAFHSAWIPFPTPSLYWAQSSSFFRIYGKCHFSCDASPILIAASLFSTFPQHLAHTPMPQQYRDSLSRWTISNMKTVYSSFIYISPGPTLVALYIVGTWEFA